MGIADRRNCCAAVLTCVVVFWLSADLTRGAPPTSDKNGQQTPAIPVGPETEKRFPPLVVPDGFKATLFACDPLVEYPSVIALGPKPGSVFVAHDYVTGLGVEIVRRDEIRLVEDTDGDGYADKSTVYAEGFNSIQGLAYHAGTVYAMHAPLLTSLRDTNGDGVADERKDLIGGLGLPPEENSNRLHCANGVVVGHDGWLYLALGDRGCDVQRPEGDRLLFQDGGILRCRADGRDLHVFSTGLRNIYDIALDEELNVFVRDNENDGGDYMIRVCHCFHGSDHGYPYHYYEQPDEAMPPLADLGRGSSAGGTSYLETAFPEAYRESLFFCEWGRAVVRYTRDRVGSSFAPMEEIDFAAGAANDPYGFKPTDLVVDRDGSLLISDWADGQRPQRGRGRIYRVAFVGSDKAHANPKTPIDGDSLDAWIGRVNSSSYYQRVEAQEEIERRGDEGYASLLRAIDDGNVSPVGRLHAVWVLAHVKGVKALDDLFELAENDDDPRVRAQAIRAIADLSDPVLVHHRLDVERGDPDTAARLASIAVNSDPRVTLEVVVALGRLRWSDAPTWLREHLKRNHDAAIAHAAMQAMPTSDNWNDVLAILDDSTSAARPVALRAVAEQALPEVVDGLLARLDDKRPQARAEYADLLGRVYKTPAPWEYWGFRPAPRAPNSVEWERTEAIEGALNGLLADVENVVRFAALRRMTREHVPVELARLAKWIEEDNQQEHVALILVVLKDRPIDETRNLLKKVVTSRSNSEANRLSALSHIAAHLTEANESQLLEIAESIEDGPVLADVLLKLGARPNVNADAILMKKLNSDSGELRAAAIQALAQRTHRASAVHVARLLNDDDVRVRRAAVDAAGKLEVQDAAPRLVELAGDDDRATRSVSLRSLKLLHQAGAVEQAVAALDHEETRLAGLEYLADFGGPPQLAKITKLADADRSLEIIHSMVRLLDSWKEREPHDSTDHAALEHAIADVQGKSGLPIAWSVIGPVPVESASNLGDHDAQRVFAEGPDAELNLPQGSDKTAKSVWLCTTNVHVSAATDVEMLASSNGAFRIALNEKNIFNQDEAGPYQPNSQRIGTTLAVGTNRIVVRVVGASDGARFHIRFRAKSSQADHERLTKLILDSRGDANRGRELFLNAKKSQCLNCHRLGDDGGRIGPDLAGVGSRFSTIHLVESILEPSRTIAPSYATVNITLNDGRVVSGVKVDESAELLTLGDNQGKMHEIKKGDVEEMFSQPRSTMPDGLEKQLTDREFLDLIAFLLSLKTKPGG